MKQRGRPSAADQQLAPVSRMGERAGKPPPPEELTEEQRDLWRAIVGAMPPDWFGRETHSTLAAYCRHVTRSRALSRVVDGIDVLAKLRDGADFSEIDSVLKACEREDRIASSLATRLRITPQSRADPKTAGRRREAQRPPSVYDSMDGEE